MKNHFIILLIFCSWSILANAQTPYFEELSKELGVDYIYPGGHSQEVGAGVTIIDVNNDGWDDFFQSGGVYPSKLWLNKGGRFIDVTSQYGLDFLDNCIIQSVVAGDINNDGFEDLFVCNYGVGVNYGDSLFPTVLMNHKGKKFVKAMSNDFAFMGHFPSASFGDVNNDGFIDLYVADYVNVMNEKQNEQNQNYGYDPICLPNRFFLNKGGKSFEEVTSIEGFQDDGCGLAVSFTDFDQDNDMDLILLNDFGGWNYKGNRIFRNNFPEFSFTDLSDSLGFYREVYGMGIGPGDFDRDGDLDYYITNIGPNFLFENKNGSLEDRAMELNLDVSFAEDSLAATSWSGIFFDYENDADLDLYVSNGNVFVSSPRTAILDPNQLFIYDPEKGFENKSKGSGINDVLSHRGAAIVDFDHDGKLDIISSLVMMNWGQFGGLDQGIKLYRNVNEAENNWIGIKLVGGGGVNKSCLGCSATLIQKDYKLIKEVDGGSGHGSQSSRILYFGLGEDEIAQEILIKWLGKGETRLENLKAGKVYRVLQTGEISVVY